MKPTYNNSISSRGPARLGISLGVHFLEERDLELCGPCLHRRARPLEFYISLTADEPQCARLPVPPTVTLSSCLRSRRIFPSLPGLQTNKHIVAATAIPAASAPLFPSVISSTEILSLTQNHSGCWRYPLCYESVCDLVIYLLYCNENQ